MSGLRRPVDRETRLGHVTIVDAAEMGRFDFEACAATVEEMVRRGVLRWVRGENRLVLAPKLVKL